MTRQPQAPKPQNPIRGKFDILANYVYKINAELLLIIIKIISAKMGRQYLSHLLGMEDGASRTFQCATCNVDFAKESDFITRDYFVVRPIVITASVTSSAPVPQH